MRPASKHRHVIDSGYARGAETRERIVLAALKLFGESGFVGASTRDIATAAGVNPPALQYYFDSKEGLYLACVEHIVSRVWAYIGDVVQRADVALAERREAAQLIEAFCDIQDRLADLIFEGAPDWRLFMARQQVGTEPEAAFEIVCRDISKRMSSTTAAIVGRLIGKPADHDETLIRSMALNGQLIIFQVTRRNAFALLRWNEVTPQRLALIKRIVRDHTVALLSGYCRQRKR
jgi:AcrR family transcriptional regulator